MQKTLAACAALSAPPLAFEIYLEHYKASFGDKLDVDADRSDTAADGRGSRGDLLGAGRKDRPSDRFGAVLPSTAWSGSSPTSRASQEARRLLRNATYNLVMGPPLLAPGCAPARRRVRDARTADGSGSRRSALPTSARRSTSQTFAPAGRPCRSSRTAPPATRDHTPDARPLSRLRRASNRFRHWDELTRDVVLGRIDHVPPRRFFTEPETATLTAFCDDVLAQDSEPRIPVLAFIDEKLYEGRLDGFQYADMPDDRDTWRLVARGLDEAVRSDGHESYAAAPDTVRVRILDAFAAGGLSGRSMGRGEHVTRVERRHARGAVGVLLPSVGVERDRVRRPGLSPRLCPHGRRPERSMGGARGARCRSCARRQTSEGLE